MEKYFKLENSVEVIMATYLQSNLLTNQESPLVKQVFAIFYNAAESSTHRSRFLPQGKKYYLALRIEINVFCVFPPKIKKKLLFAFTISSVNEITILKYVFLKLIADNR